MKDCMNTNKLHELLYFISNFNQMKLTAVLYHRGLRLFEFQKVKLILFLSICAHDQMSGRRPTYLPPLKPWRLDVQKLYLRGCLA